MSIRNRFAVLVLAAVAVTVACGGGEKQETQAPPPPAGGAAAPPAATTGGAATTGSETISGKVTFDGTVPPAEKIKLSADPKCVEMHKEGMEKQPIMVKDGGLANVFVWVKSGVTAPPAAPTEPVVLDQRGCEFQPHIVVLRTSQPLEMRNSDDALHNIHPKPAANREFNIGQALRGMSAARAFEHPEVMIPVICDIHPWMRAYVAVVDHPYFAVTGADGTYAISGLPPGKYEVEAWHETLGTQSRTVTVKASGPVWADFAYRP